jgi:hypothetical protein
MNEIITRLLDWCDEHNYTVLIDADLKSKAFPHLTIILTRNNYNVKHEFDLSGFSKNENLYPSTKWFDKGFEFELLSFLDEAKDLFSIHEAEAKNDGKV